MCRRHPGQVQRNRNVFLLAHIAVSVPEEASAYLALTEGVQSDAYTPDQTDSCLRTRFDLPPKDDMRKTFISTQRTGATSRMLDLGQVPREKSGMHMTYLITAPGQVFLNKINIQVERRFRWAGITE